MVGRRQHAQNADYESYSVRGDIQSFSGCNVVEILLLRNLVLLDVASNFLQRARQYADCSQRSKKM